MTDPEFVSLLTIFNLLLVGVSLWESKRQARQVGEISKMLREDNARLERLLVLGRERKEASDAPTL